jgi:hypothetical protein
VVGPRAVRPADAEARPSKLFYLADWLPPDFGATGQYALIFATDEAKAGRDVHLIGLTSGLPSVTSEDFSGGGRLTVQRLRAGEPDKTSNFRRLAWSVVMNARLMRHALFAERRGRPEIMFTGSPPFMAYFAVLAKFLIGARLNYRITDFYPEVVAASLGRASFLLSAAARVTWLVRRRVDRFQVLGEDQRRLLLRGGISEDRIQLVRDRAPVDFPAGLTPRPLPPELGGRRALLYSGNYGVAHEVETVVAALARHHRDGSDRVALWINGSGLNAARAADALRAKGAPVALTPPAPLADLAALLISADAHLITLRDDFVGLVVPSKVYACLDSGKPIIFVGPTDSDVHLLCSESPDLWYRQVSPGDVEGLARALEELADRTESAWPS